MCKFVLPVYSCSSWPQSTSKVFDVSGIQRYFGHHLKSISRARDAWNSATRSHATTLRALEMTSESGALVQIGYVLSAMHSLLTP